MANIDFGTNLGQTVAFNPATDTLIFGTTPVSTYYNASLLSFEQDGADLVVRVAGWWVRLASVSFGSLTSSDFSFSNGGLVRLDTAGNDFLNASTNDDYLDIRKGGSDTVNAGSGSDRIYAGSALSSGDAVNGGADFDILVLGGNYATTVTLGATTVTEVETILVEAGSTIRLALDAATISMPTGFGIDASAQLSGDLLHVDASAAVQQFSAVGGAGDDTIIGGAIENYLDGGDGDDYLEGGDGYSELVGGAGEDSLVGGSGQDMAYGGYGNDTISGGGGEDVLRGQWGDDLISGGNGDDLLYGNEGNDILDGGVGSDVFVFAGNYGGAQGNDQINGFNVVEDTFWIEGLGTFSARSESGGTTTLTYSQGTVQINGITGLTLDQWNDLLDYRFENARPVITSDGGGDTAELEILEGQVAVTTVTAVDRNPWDTPWFTIAGGADAALFGINNGTGELVFLAAPNFESPGDADYDNVYEVIVQADDGAVSDTQAISITVEDVAERDGWRGAWAVRMFDAFRPTTDEWTFDGEGRLASHQHGHFSLSTTDSLF